MIVAGLGIMIFVLTTATAMFCYKNRKSVSEESQPAELAEEVADDKKDDVKESFENLADHQGTPSKDADAEHTAESGSPKGSSEE